MSRADDATARLDDLVRHEAWLRRLAQRLVGAGEADDTVQDAMISALRQPVPRNASWLAGAIQNLVRLRRRGDARRRQREQAVARREALPSTGAIVEELDSLRLVSRAVRELDEPYRTAVLQRFYQELPTAEIARRAGVSEAAVRQRLKRGLDQLRSRLHRELGSGWRRHALIVPLVRPAVAVSFGTITMKKTLLAAGALVGALVGTTVTLDLLGEPAEPTKASVRQVEATIQEPAETDAESASARQRIATTETTADAELPPPVRRTGRVLSPLGEPLAGVAIGFAVTAGHAQQYPDLPIDANRPFESRAIATTGLDGTFAFEPERVRALPLALGNYVTLRSTPIEPGETTELSIVAAPAIELSGRVLDPKQRPATDVSIWMRPGSMPEFPGVLDDTRALRFGTTRTDSFGNFRATRLPALGGKLSFHHDATSSQADVDVPAADRTDLLVTLQRFVEHHWVVTGRVLDHEGQPVAAARVGMSEDSGYSDEHGVYRFEFSASDRDARSHSDRIYAAKFGHQGAVVDGMRERMRRADDGYVHLDLVLGPPALSIDGRVVDADGDPVERALVYPWDLEPLNAEGYGTGRSLAVEDLATHGEGEIVSWGSLATCVFAKTDTSGRFTLRALRDRDYRLMVFLPDSYSFVHEPIRAGASDVEIRLPAERGRPDLELTILDPDRRPLIDVEVRAALPALKIGERIELATLDPVRTGAEGRAILEQLPANVDRVRVSGPHILPATIPLERLDGGVVIASRRWHFRVEADEAAAAFTVLSTSGEAMTIHEFSADRHRTLSRRRLRAGSSGPVCVAEDAATLVLFDSAGRELGRRALRLVEGVVTTVR